MNLQALYDLKERLEHAAIAGTGLLQEDFRLHRAVEAMVPLSKASPVFGKIYAGAKALLTASEQERNAQLLDVLSLVDAVVYTQGVNNVPGEMEPVAPGAGNYVQIPHSQLQPLLMALNGTGSGRTAFIRESWERHPDYFGDFRVLPYLVKALGDNYGELTDLIEEIIIRLGSTTIPLLKKDFDPAGKKEMARRVRLITIKTGDAENDWLLSILPNSQKDVREAIIQSLGYCQSNTQVLLDLCSSERGKLREAALRSLALMQNEKAAAFWQGEVQKHPQSVTILNGANTSFAADLSASAIRIYLEKLLAGGYSYSSAELERMIKLMNAFCGKYSQEVHDLWLWIGSKMDRLDEVGPDHLVRGCDCTLAELLQRCMLLGVMRNPCYGMLRLARKLSLEYRKWFLCCGLIADLLDPDCPPERTYEKYSSCIKRSVLSGAKMDDSDGEQIQIMRAFAPVRYEAEKGLYCIYHSGIDPRGIEREYRQMLCNLDYRWLTLFADYRICQEGEVFDFGKFSSVRKSVIHVESLVMALIDPEDDLTCQKCGEYLYRRVKLTGKLRNYQDALNRCRWKNWRGLLTYCVQKESQIIYHQAIIALTEMPISNQEKAEELRSLNELVKSGRVSVLNRHWPDDRIQYLIARLETEDNVDIL